MLVRIVDWDVVTSKDWEFKVTEPPWTDNPFLLVSKKKQLVDWQSFTRLSKLPST